MADTRQLGRRAGSPEREAPLRAEVVTMALAGEPEPEGWERRYGQLLDDGVDLVVPESAGQPGPAAQRLADGFAVAPVADDDTVLKSLARLLVAGKAVALGLDPGAREGLASVARLRRGLANYRVAFRPAALCVPADAGPPARLPDRMPVSAGIGRIYLRVAPDAYGAVQAGGRLAMPSAGGASRDVPARRWWGEVVDLMVQDDRFRPAFAGQASAACPLAAPDPEDWVEPLLGLAVPPSAGVLGLRLNLERFVTVGGSIDERRLTGSVGVAVRLADGLLDQLAWPLPDIASDVRRQRRIALLVAGLGLAVDRMGLHPQGFRALERLRLAVAAIRDAARLASARLAAERGRRPGDEAPGLRHRELVAMSPWEVVSPNCLRPSDYLGLVPAVAFADRVAWRRPWALAGMPASLTADICRLTWAARHRPVEAGS